ncbi:MAG: tRNA (N(6)-L-threonylcarbamoyladenosine(37)-C(2))-methylthiotransferase MtaB [Anaerolineae bacterium]|nr:tRNA (N(6)-L-threonylcarbamoyladenosine(37)-C(2))-methylthiotransferase MtaB [Anaerolineae bacterium]MDW8100618.1 tRNA (N(6)-L-threonylcarbamoyladenosine(37)-C(2))-methylthiotransferase MtaB [Anaerolineae bacterium]
MRIYLETLGCRLNFSEMERLARELSARGLHVVQAPSDADVCVLNTCAVTTTAEAKSRALARALARANPHARLAITGCYATLAPTTVQRLPQVRLVVDNREKERLADLLALWAEELPHRPADEVFRPDCPPFAATRTRAFVKVQDGCNNRCTFCIVTVARGEERSRPLAAVVNEINALVAEGYQEAVLTGVHLGAYGRDLGTNLASLVRAILRQTRLPRLRLSSLEPWDLGPDFFDLWRESEGRLCPHLHLPLQSGCDATLRRMARRYTTASYARLVECARERIPHLTITTDIIVGFPGETDEEFQQSLRFVESMRFAHLHVFPYSPRPGTAAARMKGQVPEAVKRERSAVMRDLDARSGREVRRAQLGQVRPVLWEGDGQPLLGTDQRVWTGLTDNYLRVLTMMPADVGLHNRITPVRLDQLEGDALWGKVIEVTN